MKTRPKQTNGCITVLVLCVVVAFGVVTVAGVLIKLFLVIVR